MRQNINFGKLLHGGDYNPEQWLEYPEILEQDLAYFKKAKINEVSLGIFSWAFLEPEEGVFDLEWLKKMVDRLYENGISAELHLYAFGPHGFSTARTSIADPAELCSRTLHWGEDSISWLEDVFGAFTSGLLALQTEIRWISFYKMVK